MIFWQKKSKSFFDYFEEQSKEILGVAHLLESLFSEKSSGMTISRQIHEREHAGDRITRTVIHKMNTEGFILPIDHDDILLFTKTMDDVIDSIDESADS